MTTNGIIRFNQNVTGDINEAVSREWLETNGLGGFAASTIIGWNTRRYHGLLVAATNRRSDVAYSYRSLKKRS